MSAAKKTKKKPVLVTRKAKAWCKVTLVAGPGGYAVYVNDVRVCGEKPWGGGNVVADWRPLASDVELALKAKP